MHFSKQRQTVRKALKHKLSLAQLAYVLGVSVGKARELVDQERIQIQKEELHKHDKH